MTSINRGWGRVCLGSLAGAGLGVTSFVAVEALAPQPSAANAFNNGWEVLTMEADTKEDILSKLDDFDGVFANFRITKHGYGVDLKVTANCRTGKLETETNPEWRDIMPGSNFYHISTAYCGL